MRVLAVLALSLAVFTGTACAGSNFAGTSGTKKEASGNNRSGNDGEDGGRTPSKEDTLGTNDGIDSGNGAGQLGGVAGGNDAAGDADSSSDTGKLITADAIAGKDDGTGLKISDDGIVCIPKLLPLHVVFAIDSTGSMDEEIQAVRNGIVQFANEALKIVPEGSGRPLSSVKIGAVSYVDAPADNRTIALTDAQSFAGALSSMATRGGINDHCEGGLQAAKAGLDMLVRSAAAISGGIIPVLVVISDNYSHNGIGGNGSRSFEASSVQDALKDAKLNNVLVYDAVPQTTGVPKFTACNVPAGPPADQWRHVRQGWKDRHPKAKREPGASLGFPFGSDGGLTSKLPGELKKMLKLCKP